MAEKPKVCKDCVAEGITTSRPAPHPGPRCVTHHRARKRIVSERNAARRVENTYGISWDERQAIIAYQDGTCAICKRATGATRRLSVDHDHNVGCGHAPEVGCKNCVRGCLCRPCNDLLGIARDNVDFFQRAIQYLLDPPAKKVLDAND